MRKRFWIWGLVAVSSLVTQALARNLAIGVWMVTLETVVQALVTSVVQIAALEIVRRVIWRRAW